MQVLCTFDEKSSSFFQYFFYSKVGMMPLVCAWTFLQEIRILKINTYHTSESEITLGMIYLKSSELYKRKVEWYNIWLLSWQKGIKTIKYWNYKVDIHGKQLANRLFECIYQPLFPTRLLIWVTFSRVITSIEIGQKIWFQRVSLYQCFL